MNKKIQEAVKEDTEKYNRLQMTHALMKWRLVTQIIKMKMGDERFANSTLEDVIEAIQKGTNNVYMEQVKEMNREIGEMKEREVEMGQMVEQVKYSNIEKDLKI